MKSKLVIVCLLLIILLSRDYLLRKQAKPTMGRGYTEGEIEFVESELMLVSIQTCADEIEKQVEKIRSIIKQKGE